MTKYGLLDQLVADNNGVIKTAGLLVSAMVGLDARSTMGIDATVND